MAEVSGRAGGGDVLAGDEGHRLGELPAALVAVDERVGGGQGGDEGHGAGDGEAHVDDLEVDFEVLKGLARLEVEVSKTAGYR